MKMPPKMEPYFGENRFRRSLDIHDDVILQDFDFVAAPVENEYTEAYRRGKDGSCRNHYASCPINVFKLLNL